MFYDFNAILFESFHSFNNGYNLNLSIHSTTGEIQEHGRMNWQKENQYGRRNTSELSIQRRKRILGNQLHARDISRQKVEAMIGSGILNKMTALGMPQSYRCA